MSFFEVTRVNHVIQIWHYTSWYIFFAIQWSPSLFYLCLYGVFYVWFLYQHHQAVPVFNQVSYQSFGLTLDSSTRNSLVSLHCCVELVRNDQKNMAHFWLPTNINLGLEKIFYPQFYVFGLRTMILYFIIFVRETRIGDMFG